MSDSEESSLGDEEPPRSPPAVGRLTWCLALSFVLSGTLFLLAKEPLVRTNHRLYRPTEFEDRHAQVSPGRPADDALYGTFRVNPPPVARDADRRFLAGHHEMADRLYREARARSADVYAPTLLVCLAVENGRLPEATEILASIDAGPFSQRTLILLEFLVAERLANPRGPLDDAYLRALAACADDPRFLHAPRADLLHRWIENRLYAPSLEEAEPPARLGSVPLEFLRRVIAEAVGREELLAALERPLSLADRSIVLGSLLERFDETKRVAEALDLLAREYPDNGYFDVMAALLQLPAWSRPSEEEDIGRASEHIVPSDPLLQRIEQGLARPSFDPLGALVSARLEELRRAEGRSQSLSEREAPARWNFLHDPSLPARLVDRLATEWVDPKDRAPLLRLAAGLLAKWQSFDLDPLNGSVQEIDSLTAALAGRAAEWGIDVDDEILAVPARPMPPGREWRALQPFLDSPPPIPSLLHSIPHRYRLDPGAVIEEVEAARSR